MDVLETIKGLQITGFGESFYGTFSKDTNNRAYYLTGFATYFSNGWKMINGGGSCSSQDFVSMTILDEGCNIIYENEIQF